MDGGEKDGGPCIETSVLLWFARQMRRKSKRIRKVGNYQYLYMDELSRCGPDPNKNKNKITIKAPIGHTRRGPQAPRIV